METTHRRPKRRAIARTITGFVLLLGEVVIGLIEYFEKGGMITAFLVRHGMVITPAVNLVIIAIGLTLVLMAEIENRRSFEEWNGLEHDLWISTVCQAIIEGRFYSAGASYDSDLTPLGNAGGPPYPRILIALTPDSVDRRSDALKIERSCWTAGFQPEVIDQLSGSVEFENGFWVCGEPKIARVLREAGIHYSYTRLSHWGSPAIILGRNIQTLREYPIHPQENNSGLDAALAETHAARVAPITSGPESSLRLVESVPLVGEPDVALEFTSPGPFVLHNFGATACEVQVSSLVLPEFYEVAFRMIPDLHSEPIEIVPDVRPIGLWASMQLHRESIRPDIMGVLNSAARGKAVDLQLRKSGGTHTDSGETDRLVNSMTEPIPFVLTVTFSNRDNSRSWSKEETLLYVASTRHAHIRHGKRVEAVNSTNH